MKSLQPNLLFFTFALMAATPAVAETPSVAPPAPAKPIPAALVKAITSEVLRPNGDPEGYPLPLAARWTPHNLLDANTGAPKGKTYFVSYPFTIDRVLDDIAAGHRVMPFLGWPHASAGPNSYNEETASFQRGFRRLAAAKLPFEIEAGNIEVAMLQRSGWPEPAEGWPVPAYAHQRPATHPGFIVHGFSLKTTAVAAKDGKTLVVNGFAANASLPVGTWLVLAEAGRTVALAAEAKADAAGTATLTINEALPTAIPEGETLLRVEKRMDFWSKAPEAVWRQGGAAIVTQGGSYSLDDWKKLAAIYPDPPQIQIVSNNEGAKGHIGESATSAHAQQRKGEDLPTAFGKGYVSIWQAYMRGMREALPWKPEKIKTIGYNGFGVNFEVGRWGGWVDSAVPHDKVDFFGWLAWDGSAPDYYAYDWNYATDEHVGSPHIGAMQAYTMLSQRAMQQVPNYQWQLALWDGGVQKRYRYASDGTLSGVRVGEVASVPENGSTSIQLRGGKPGATVLDIGDIISIAGHSPVRATTCSVEFEKLVFESDAGELKTIDALTLSDIGAVPAPGSLTREGGKVTLRGSGKTLSAGIPDSITFAQHDFTGMRSVSLRLLAFGEGNSAPVAKPKAPSAVVPDTAAHVDRAALEQQRALDDVTPSDQAGLMLRNGTSPHAAFLAIMRSRSGGIVVMWRGEDDPILTSYSGGVASAEVPAGPVYVRFTREQDKYYRPYWSVDGTTWTVIGDATKLPSWIGPGKNPLVAGPVVTTNTVWQNFQYFTVKEPVLPDANGQATIQLDSTNRSGPVGSGPSQPAMVVGAAIEHREYVPRYEGFSNLALWLTRPRIIREFAWGDYDRVIENHWKALMRATDQVWNDPVLTRFWRKGKLMANPAYTEQTKNLHPMNETGEFWDKRWAGLDRFFQLSVAINPPFTQWPAGNGVTRTATEQPGALIKVWAIAYELGTAPKREWLLITQSPREDRKAVVVTVPGYGDTTVDVARRGSFHHLREGAKTPVQVGTR